MTALDVPLFAHACEGDDVAVALGSDPVRGLSAAEAAARVASHGRNELVEATDPGWWPRLRRQFESPLVSLLGLAIVISLVAWWLDGASGVPLEATVVAAIMVTNASIGFLQEGKAATAIAALRSLVSATTTVIRDDRATVIPASDVVPGDVVVVGLGDVVPADGRVLESHGLLTGEAALTGEGHPVAKQASPVDSGATLGDRSSMVYSGTDVVGGRGRLVVTATGMSTQLGDIAVLLHQVDQPDTPLERELASVSRTLGWVVIMVALAVLAASAAVSGVSSTAEAVDLLLIAVALAVAAVPEGLPAILSLVLAIGVRRMAGRNALLKRLASAETLGSTTVICSDKTGTLTRNEMSVQQVVTASGAVLVHGDGYAPVGSIEVSEGVTDAAQARTGAQRFLSGAVLASDATVCLEGINWSAHGNPTEAALVAAASRSGLDVAALRRRFRRVQELPFDTDRKRMSVWCEDTEHPGSLTMFTKGAPDLLLPLCSHQAGAAGRTALSPAGRQAWADTVASLADDAMRTIAVAQRRIPAVDDRGLPAPEINHDHEAGLTLLGVSGIIDPPRPQVPAAVAEAQAAGIRILMVTGDHPNTAARIALDVGIANADRPPVIGSQLDVGTDRITELLAETAVFSRVTPRQKLELVEALQRQGHVVAVTGDGVNDAPALRAADIGIAMGVTGSDVSKGAADMILVDDDFATIVAAVEEGRSIFQNIKSFLRYLLSSNAGEVLTMVLGLLFATVIGLESGADGFVAPLAATQILWINLLTDSGPALALGLDPTDSDVMRRPPRAVNDRLIDTGMVSTVLALGSTMAVAALVMLDAGLPGGLIEGTHDLDTARTGAFTVLVLAQLFNAFNTRSAEHSAFRRMLSNRWLLAAVALSLALQVLVVHAPPLNDAFSTAPLSGTDWMLAAALASSVLWVGEARKAWRRRVLRKADTVAATTANLGEAR